MSTRKRKIELLQMNLALPAEIPADLPREQETELALALAELLIQAWKEATTNIQVGVQNEPETNS
jgi:hypothetical protein